MLQNNTNLCYHDNIDLTISASFCLFTISHCRVLCGPSCGTKWTAGGSFKYNLFLRLGLLQLVAAVNWILKC